MRIAKVSGLSFEHKNLVSGSSYLYTVRAVDAAGRFIGDFDHAGYAYRFIGIPALKSISNVNGGQMLAWNTSNGAGAYRVYIKGTGSWKFLAQTTATSYLSSDITSGNKYYYTVRAIDANDPANFSFYSSKPLWGVYIATPKIVGYKPIKGGNTVLWKASRGAFRYGVFIKSSGKWKRIAVTDKTSYNHTGLKNGFVYTYTIRCINKKGKYCSGYVTEGKNIRYLAPPVLTGVSGKTVKWSENGWAAGYRVYRKEYSKSWETLGDTDTASYTDTTMKANTPYTYAARCLNASGYLISYYQDTGNKYYANGKLANGTFTVGGRTVIFVNGVVRMKGYVTINGKTYYYDSKGVLQKNGIVGTYQEGYRYADKNGVVIMNYTGVATKGKNTWYFYKGKINYKLRDAVTVNGVAYNVLNGKAYKVTSTKDKILYRALKIVTKVTKSSMTNAQKLRACWNHMRTAYGENNPRNPEYYASDWAEVYANDIFVGKSGNCFSYAAAFAYIGKAIGYSKCYACNSGGHGWTEIDGLVYDVEWSMHSTKYTYYAMSYDDPCDVPYKAALTVGSTWAHVKV